MNQDIKNVIPLLVLMAVSIMFSCTHRVKKDSVKVPTEIVSVPTPAPVSSPLPVELGAVNVKLVPAKGSLQWQIDITKKSEEKMNQIVKSKCFYDFIASQPLIQTNGKNPVEVANHLQGLTGTIPVVFYYRSMKSPFNPFGTSAVAYRQPPEILININTAYFGERSNICELSSTMFHEAGAHTLGNYDHDYYYSSSRNNSVPYAVNRAFDACCK